MSEDIKELPNVLKELPNGKKPKSKPSPYSKASVVSIDDIHEDPANLRLHDSRNISTIESSLVALGPGRSIVLDAKDVIRAGNGTIQAAKNAGFKEVLIVEPGPDQIVAVKRADWTPTEARQYSVVDNRASEVGSTWDKGPLYEELEALQNEGIDIESMGWSDEDVKLLSKELEKEIQGSEPKESKKQVNPPEEFKEYNENIEVDHICPRCGFKFSGGETEERETEELAEQEES